MRTDDLSHETQFFFVPMTGTPSLLSLLGDRRYAQALDDHPEHPLDDGSLLRHDLELPVRQIEPAGAVASDGLSVFDRLLSPLFPCRDRPVGLPLAFLPGPRRIDQYLHDGDQVGQVRLLKLPFGLQGHQLDPGHQYLADKLVHRVHVLSSEPVHGLDDQDTPVPDLALLYRLEEVRQRPLRGVLPSESRHRLVGQRRVEDVFGVATEPVVQEVGLSPDAVLVRLGKGV